jgi:hypothetical protein
MIQRNRFSSFSPITRGQRAAWFVNARDYYRFLVPMLRVRVALAKWVGEGKVGRWGGGEGGEGGEEGRWEGREARRD